MFDDIWPLIRRARSRFGRSLSRSFYCHVIYTEYLSVYQVFELCCCWHAGNIWGLNCCVPHDCYASAVHCTPVYCTASLWSSSLYFTTILLPKLLLHCDYQLVVYFTFTVPRECVEPHIMRDKIVRTARTTACLFSYQLTEVVVVLVHQRLQARCVSSLCGRLLPLLTLPITPPTHRHIP